MDIGDLISRYRKEAGMTIDELVEKSGVPKGTVNKIIGGTTKAPTLDTVKSLAFALNKTLSDFDDAPAIKTKVPFFSDEAKKVALDYSRLDGHGRRIVLGVIAEEQHRMEGNRHRGEPKAVYPINDYMQPASAGYGDFTDDASYDVVDLVKRPPHGTAFLITVDGDSMEPTYHDGDKLFIKAQNEVKVGEVGLFAVGADMFVKEQGVDCLLSHNPKYPPKYPEMDTIVKVYGKVLGVCTDDYFGK